MLAFRKHGHSVKLEIYIMSYSTKRGSAFAKSHVCGLMFVVNKCKPFPSLQMLAAIVISILGAGSVGATQQMLSSQNDLFLLDKAITLAHERDPWLASSKYKERSMMAQSEASLALPDPVVSLSIANVPTDGFSFNQEPMTQLKAGVSQMLPRGNSRHIQSQYQEALALEQPFLRMERIAKSTVMVTALWLEAYKAQAKIILVEENQVLLIQLGDIAKANYASAIGNTRQQDVISADLEVNKIKDRLIQLKAQKIASIERLNEWLQLDNLSQTWTEQSPGGRSSIGYLHAITLPKTLPAPASFPVTTLAALNSNKRQTLANILSSHPTIQAIDQRISASKTAIDLAKQKYNPQWGLNASYAYRDDDQLGASRADFLSVGISFDVPLYTSQKQDNEVSASVYKSESIKTDKRLALRQLISQLAATYTLHKQLQERLNLYKMQILPQTIEQAETVLNAFTNNDGDFDEVVQAQITQLNAQLSLLDIEVEQHKVHSQLTYYMTTTTTTQKAL
ncbi:MAG: outer membrane protein TolC [Alphaproteobacteria bacterium]|jgi:outer membrane protein TolC